LPAAVLAGLQTPLVAARQQLRSDAGNRLLADLFIYENSLKLLIMNHALQFPLATSAEQTASLAKLQATFAAACNALVPVVRERRCWNRIALHHLAYHELRSRFPQLGAQMACNAIYSVSRTCRQLFQHPASPWHLARLGERPLPMIEFAPRAPVYFDRHTLSLKHDGISMYTLDGRMRFALSMPDQALVRFKSERLREIVLARQGQGYALTFLFGADCMPGTAADLPEYVVIREPAPVTVTPQLAAAVR